MKTGKQVRRNVERMVRSAVSIHSMESRSIVSTHWAQTGKREAGKSDETVQMYISEMFNVF